MAKEIGLRIQRALERIGVTTTALGEAWGTHRQTAQHWTKGNSLPKASEIPRLCELLGIDANHLFGMHCVHLPSAEDNERLRLRIEELAAANIRAKNKGGTARLAPKKSRAAR